MECDLTANKEKCPCTAMDCPRRGACCQCLASHLSHKSLPRCCFPDDASAKDRSFGSFARAWKVNG